MGLYLRKSFGMGPVRLNLSKSGIGASAGVKGGRVGLSGDGRLYSHAGRKGVYYRKYEGTERKESYYKKHGETAPKIKNEEEVLSPPPEFALDDLSGCLGRLLFFSLIIAVLCFAFGFYSRGFFFLKPAGVISIIYIGVKIGAIINSNAKAIVKNTENEKKSARWAVFTTYKSLLRKNFFFNELPPDQIKIDEIKKQRRLVLLDQEYSQHLPEFEKETYSFVLKKILDDRKITNQEKKLLGILESIITVDKNYKISLQKEAFTRYYLDIIDDHQITNEEYETIKNILQGLSLKKQHIEKELETIKSILRIQKIQPPLSPLDEEPPIKLKKNENIFYSGYGKVLSKRKAPKESYKEYEYTVRRKGVFVITDKRILIVSEGTTQVDFKKILDIDVDIDNSMIIISKDSTQIPVFIQTDDALYPAKIIDILTSA